MYLKRLTLTDWRNYTAAEVHFGPGANVLAGSNGQGKTNLVEAVGYLSTLGSHRVSGDAALIRAGAESAVVRAVVVTGDREVLAEVLLNRSAPNRAQVNRSAVRPREVTRAVSSVLFAPEDLQLVRGEPSARRRFVDELLVARTPRLAGVLGDYEKALKQRNGLLRTARARPGVVPPTLEVWDERLALPGAELLEARAALVADLAPVAAEQYAVVAGADQRVTMRPVQSIDEVVPPGDADATSGADAGGGARAVAGGGPPADAGDGSDAGGGARADAGGETDARAPSRPGGTARSTAERFVAALQAVRRRELERGITLVGPHRDDLLLEINGLPARGYASHGESWSLALALRLGAVELLRAALPGGDPIVILDDVFAELDERRRQRLAERAARYEQVLITAAVEADIPESLRGAVTRIRSGTVLTEDGTGDAARDDPGHGGEDDRGDVGGDERGG